MQAGHLVVREETLGTTALRYRESTLLGVLHHDSLGNRSDTVTNTAVDARVAELLNRPLLESLHNIRVCSRREDRGLLRAECKDWGAEGRVRGAPDDSAEGVHGPDSCVALQEGKRHTTESHGTDGNAPDDVHEVGMHVSRLLNCPQQCRAWQADVRERGERVRERVRTATVGKQSASERICQGLHCGNRRFSDGREW